MKKNILLAIFALPLFLIGQKLNLNEFILLCNKKNWNEVNVLISSKGWDYYNSKSGDSETYNEVSWSYDKEYYSDKAKGWVTLYTYEGLPSKIWYQVFNKKIFTQIESSIASAGFKLINTDISNNIVDAEYSNDKYTLNISYSKIENDDYYESASTAYTIIVTKKGTIYDPDNGKKYEYNDDFEVIGEYNLKDGELHGEFISFYPGGAKKTVSHWNKGKLSGTLLDFDENGITILENHYTNGMLDGLHKEFTNGTLTREINFKSNLENGIEKIYFDNGKIKSTVAYSNGKKNGVELEYDDRGIQISKQTFINGIQNGPFEFVVFDDVKPTHLLDGNLLNGEFDGRINVRHYNTRDTFRIEFYDHGLKTGRWKEYENKKLSLECFYKNDKLDGLSISYFTSGENEGKIISETNFKEDQKHGFENIYFKYFQVVNENGEDDGFIFLPVQEHSTFEFGKLDGPYSYDDFANTFSKGNYKNDLKSGFWVETLLNTYWESNEYPLIYKGNYVDGKKEGEWKGFIDGKIYVINNFNSGLLNGSNQFYEKNGDFGTKSIYKNGDKIELHFYKENLNNETIFLIGNVNSLNQFQYVFEDEKFIQKIDFSISSQVNMDDSEFLTFFDEQTKIWSASNTADLINKSGNYYLKTPLLIIKGNFYNNQKNGSWESKYLDQSVIHLENFSMNKLYIESFINMDESPFNGTFTIKKEFSDLSIKIKNGLRNGNTIESINGEVISKRKYKNGVEKT